MSMNNIFDSSAPIFVKPLGVIVAGHLISPKISVSYTSEIEYGIKFSNDPLNDCGIEVVSKCVINIFADYVVSSSINSLLDGSENFNIIEEEKAIQTLRLNKEISATPKRGRKKETEEENEFTDAEIENNIFEVAHSTLLNSYEMTVSSKPLLESDPVANRGGDFVEKVETVVAKLQKIINDKNLLRQKLKAPSENDIMETFTNDDLLTTKIDSEGLNNYENTIRQRIKGMEETIQKLYTNIANAVMNYNEKVKEEKVPVVFTDDICVNDLLGEEFETPEESFEGIYEIIDDKMYITIGNVFNAIKSEVFVTL